MYSNDESENSKIRVPSTRKHTTECHNLSLRIGQYKSSKIPTLPAAVRKQVDTTGIIFVSTLKSHYSTEYLYRNHEACYPSISLVYCRRLRAGKD
jgi:predicted Zn-dependent protease